MTFSLLQTHFYLVLLAAGVGGWFISYLLYPFIVYIPQRLIKHHYSQEFILINPLIKNYYQLSFFTFNILLSILIVKYFGFSWIAITNLLLAYGLLLLAYIDFVYYLLPDCLTLPLLWVGLFCNTFNLFVLTSEAIWGAIVGYLSLWIIAKLFKYFRGIDGIGHGDMKLLALFGAWWGANSLIFIIMLSSLLGILVGLIQTVRKQHNLQKPMAFGPYLIFSGFFVMFFHPYFKYYICLLLD